MEFPDEIEHLYLLEVVRCRRVKGAPSLNNNNRLVHIGKSQFNHNVHL